MVLAIFIILFVCIPFIIWMGYWEEDNKRKSRELGIHRPNSGTASNSCTSVRMGTTVPSITEKETS